MVFNGIISLILLVPPEDAESLGILFCEKIMKAGQSDKGDKRMSTRIKLLSNLFHGLPETSPVRYTVYLAMLRLAGQADMLQMIPTELDQVKTWIAQWGINIQKKQNLYRVLHEVLLEAKQSKQATKVMIELLGTYTEDNASQARDDAHRCIVTCLNDPDTYLMDHLLTLKPVKFLEGESIHNLLTIFVSGKLSQYQQFYKNNTDFVKSLGLSDDQNMRKMRLLTFMQMAENRKEISYATIIDEMQLGDEDVEDFVIEVLRTKAVRAKIDQMQKKVIIFSTTHRTFSKQQWQLLRQYLSQWKSNLHMVESNLQSLSTLQSQTPQA
ncbi:eukaryotic translation initiation factor 3 subunit M-like isoform X2 [Gigantopelta aegis]|nr:eukaryotic translation initiation factor 3 subunit M-like isoform X2 [Gigantopelta aegis]